MGFFDNIRDKILSFTDEDEQYFEEDLEQGSYASSHGLLGNSSRPEADSVSVHARGTSQGASAANGANFSEAQTPASPTYRPASIEGVGTPTIRETRSNNSGQLPPYVFRPEGYEDVQMVFRRIKTNQPVVLNFIRTDALTSRRILDFCFGFVSGIGGVVEQLSKDVFVILPPGITLSAADKDRLGQDGSISR